MKSATEFRRLFVQDVRVVAQRLMARLEAVGSCGSNRVEGWV